MSELNCNENKVLNSILSRKERVLFKEILIDWPTLNDVVHRFINKVGIQVDAVGKEEKLIKITLLNAIDAYEVTKDEKLLSKKYRDFIEVLVQGVSEMMLYQITAYNSDDAEISTLDVLKEDFESWAKNYQDCEIRAEKIHDINKLQSHKNNINLLILHSICSINDLINLNVIPDLSQNRFNDIWD